MAGEVIGQGVIIVDADTTSAQAALQSAEAAATKAGTAGAVAGGSMRQAFSSAAKSLQQSALVSELETVGSLGIQVGGSFSKLAIIFTSLVRPVSIAMAVLGPLPLAIGAGTAAALGGAIAIRSYASSMVEAGVAAAEAGGRLQELGLLAEGERELVEELQAAVDRAAIAEDRLTVARAEANGSIKLITEGYTGLKVVAASVTGRLGEVGAAVVTTRQEMLAAIPIVGGLVAGYADLAGPGGGNPGVLVPVNWALRELARISLTEVNPALLKQRQAISDLVAELDKVPAAARGPGGDMMDVIRADAAEELEIQADMQRVLQSELDAQRERERAAQAERLQLERETSAQALAARQDYFRAVVAAAQKAEQDEIDSIEDVRRAESRAHDDLIREVEQIEQARADASEKYKQQVQDDAFFVSSMAASSVGNALSGIQNIADGHIRSFQDRMSAGEQFEEWEIRQYNQAISNSKIAAITQAAVHSAIAGAGVAANLAPLIGPAAIPAGVAAGAALFFATVTAIRTESPLSLSLATDATEGRGGEEVLDAAAGQGPETKDGTVGPKGENAEAPEQRARTSGGGITIGLDPRLKTLQITTNARPGKLPPRGGR